MIRLGLETKNRWYEVANRAETVRKLFALVGWYPGMSRVFAGALSYTRYGWLTRVVMRRIAEKAGGGTDTSRDYEYTDWDDVRQFARRFSDQLVEPHLRAG